MSETKISCPNCDQHILLDEAWSGQTLPCPSCERPFSVPHLAPTTAPAQGRLRVGAVASHPSPSPTADAENPMGAASHQSPTPPTRTSGLAIASLVLSLVGCFGITAIAGVVCGHLARKRIRNDPSQTGAGIALAGIILGYVFLAFTVVSLVTFVSRVRQAGKEFSAEIQREMAKASREQASQPGGRSADEGMSMSMGMDREKIVLPAPAGAVAGNIMGQKFTYTKAELNKDGGILTISDGKEFFADREVKLFLFLEPGQRLENNTLKYIAKGNAMSPHVHLSWKKNQKAGGIPETEIITSGYELELKMGAIRSNTITGSIILKATGKTHADLQGNFHAVLE